VTVEPQPEGRLDRLRVRAEESKARLEAAREQHAAVEFGWAFVERDLSIGGGLLAGALAYRLFVLLLPTTLFLVTGLGLYAGAADKSTGEVARESGLHGLFAANVAATAGGGKRLAVFVLMIPAILYAAAKLYRALAIVHGIAWHGTGRAGRTTPAGVLRLLGVIAAAIVATALVGVVRSHDRLGGLFVLLVYAVVVGGAWFVLSLELPHGSSRWNALVPGALVFGVGLLGVEVFNVYVTTRLLEGQANTYGALGIATALLFSLVLVGRLAVVSAELNAQLATGRTPPPEV
jgi:hypothetical protein